MPDRCKAFFDGVEVQVSFGMTRSPGASPDTGSLVFRQGATQPSNQIGDLVFMNGASVVVTMQDCILVRPSERRTPLRDWVYQVMDRRWKWRTVTVFGYYNVRDDKTDVIAGTAKNLRELASLLLDALGETGYDVTALPTDPDLAPEVAWHYTPAAVELEKLCAFCGCSVHLLNDNTVKIITDNTGAEPDDTGLMYPVDSGLITNQIPDYITAYAGDTLFDSWLTVEDIGKEVDGTVKPIDLLSYKPTAGWNIDPKNGFEVPIRNTLRGTMDEELIDKRVEAASRFVYRMFRVTGFPEGQRFFPGFVLETPVAAVGDLPEEGDPSKVYDIAGQRTAIWDGTSYIGVTYTLSSATDYCLIDPELIGNINVDPVISQGTKTVVKAARITHGIARYVMMEPGTTAVDTRILLPLLQTRVMHGVNESGEFTRLEAEVCGLYFEDDFKLRNRLTTNLMTWKHGLSIDVRKGYLMLGQAAYRWNAGIEPAKLYLRCGYRYRQRPYASIYHRQYNKPTGSTLGIANGTVNRQDVQEYRVQIYTADYNDLSLIDAPLTNTATIDTILNNAATENLKQYQNQPAPKRKVYTPFRAIDTNGKVMQVSYSGGQGRVGETSVSIGGHFDLSQPPAKQKRMVEQQRKQAEADLQNFRAAQAIELRDIA